MSELPWHGCRRWYSVSVPAEPGVLVDDGASSSGAISLTARTSSSSRTTYSSAWDESGQLEYLERNLRSPARSRSAATTTTPLVSHFRPAGSHATRRHSSSGCEDSSGVGEQWKNAWHSWATPPRREFPSGVGLLLT